MIKRILVLSVLLLLPSCEVLQLKKDQKLDCSNLNRMHPKNQSICVFQKEIALLRNKKIRDLVKAFQKEGLENSGYYNVTLISGGGVGEGVFWRYLVSVDFNNLKKYQSLLGLVEISAHKPPKILRAFSGSAL